MLNLMQTTQPVVLQRLAGAIRTFITNHYAKWNAQKYAKTPGVLTCVTGVIALLGTAATEDMKPLYEQISAIPSDQRTEVQRMQLVYDTIYSCIPYL